MSRKKALNLFRPGECFAAEATEDEAHEDLVGSVLRAALAYRIDKIEAERIYAVSATGNACSFDSATQVTPIARGGYDRLCAHHHRALQEREGGS